MNKKLTGVIKLKKVEEECTCGKDAIKDRVNSDQGIFNVCRNCGNAREIKTRKSAKSRRVDQLFANTEAY